MKLKTLIKNWGYPLAELLFPRICPICSKSLLAFEYYVCSPCMLNLPFTHYAPVPDNKIARVFWGRAILTHCSALLHYRKGNSVQKLIHHLKYKGRQDIGEHLGALLGETLKEIPELMDLEGIVPVPLHPKKERIRGYNQSLSIAVGVASVLQVPVITNIVKRNHYSTSQTRKGRYDRYTNAKEKFSVIPKNCPPSAHLLLVDDVITTGSTLEALAEAFAHTPDIRLSAAALGSTC